MQNSQVASCIKTLCKKNNITINSLIENCKLTKSFIYDMEKRDKTPSVDRLERIADYFDVSLDYLVGRTDNPKSHKS